MIYSYLYRIDSFHREVLDAQNARIRYDKKINSRYFGEYREREKDQSNIESIN